MIGRYEVYDWGVVGVLSCVKEDAETHTRVAGG
jgi:hypothetical protein